MKEILVYADWVEVTGPRKMGLLRAETVRGEEVFSFEYDKDWLQSGHAQVLDPDLKLFAGPQYVRDDKLNFGLFLDSSPDRWGRTLMKRREILHAQKDDRKHVRLLESDFLLGVNDVSRPGAIRFKLDTNGPFLDNDTFFPTPPFSSIRELEQASLVIESDNFYENENAGHWLKLLIAPGSSLGGARPKASVRAPDGHLWIAKFPSNNDDKNRGAWEFIASQLAVEAGLRVAQSQAQIFSQKHHTFLSKRFDRDIDGRRIHFASAMTLLGYKDGISQRDGVSYLELVEIIESYGANPAADLEELWKRIVFSIYVTNTDDHLRNHGFLLTPKGWLLSPAYDINPNENGMGLSLNINEYHNTLDIELALSVREYFRIDKKDALAFIQYTNKTVGGWRIKARQMKIPNNEQEMMSPAFIS